MGDTATFRSDLEGLATLIPLAFTLPLTKHSCFLSPNCSPQGPVFFEDEEERKDHPEQKGLSLLSSLRPEIQFCQEKKHGKYSTCFCKSSAGRRKGSEDNIMILFSGGKLQVPLFQLQGFLWRRKIIIFFLNILEEKQH